MNSLAYKLPFGMALLLHALLFIVIFCTFSFSSKARYQPTIITNVRIIEARAVDQRVLDQQIAERHTREQQKKAAEQERLTKLKMQAEAVALKKEQERQHIAELAAQKIKEEQHQQELAKEKAKQEAEAKRQEVLKKQQAELAKQKQVQEQKRQADAAKQKQQQLAADKKKADDKRKREEALIDKQLAEEAYQLASARKSQYQTEIDKYRALIAQAISQYWIVPETASRDVSCVLLIRVAPGGVVLDVKVARSSGDFILDRSAMSAVYRASPLPMPTDKELVEMFRELRLTVKPEGYLEG